MDHPTYGKWAIEESGARATEAGGEELFRSLMPFLENFSTEYRERYANPAWNGPQYEYFRRIYADGRWCHPVKQWLDKEALPEDIKTEDASCR